MNKNWSRWLKSLAFNWMPNVTQFQCTVASCKSKTSHLLAYALCGIHSQTKNEFQRLESIMHFIAMTMTANKNNYNIEWASGVRINCMRAVGQLAWHWSLGKRLWPKRTKDKNTWLFGTVEISIHTASTAFNVSLNLCQHIRTTKKWRKWNRFT